MAKAKPHNWKKFNEWRFNKKVDINEENESLWTWIYKGMIGGFRKAGKEGGQHLSDVAQATAFLVKTEFGSAAKKDFMKEFKKWM